MGESLRIPSTRSSKEVDSKQLAMEVVFGFLEKKEFIRKKKTEACSNTLADWQQTLS